MRTALFVLALAWPLAAFADTVRTVSHTRVLLSDVIDHAPQGLADVDLGPAPQPGGSRVITREEVQAHLRGYGVDLRTVSIPERVRVAAAGRRFSIAELGELARPVIEKALPTGVSLTDVTPKFEIFVSPCATAGEVKMPKPPRRKGEFRTVATFELTCGSDVVARVPLPIVLDVSEAAATPDVHRGGRVDLVLTRGAVRISTPGSLQADANIGETVGATVLATGRMVRVRLSTRSEAEVVETP